MAEVHVSPPYLRYNSSIDAVQIVAKRKAALEKLRHRPLLPAKELTTQSNILGLKKFDKPTKSIKGITTSSRGALTVEAAPASDVGIKPNHEIISDSTGTSEEVVNSPHTLKTTSVTSPSGDVHIGWWCSTGFHALVSEPHQAVYEWTLQIGPEIYSLLIETTDQDSSIFFPVDGQTYGAAYNSLSSATIPMILGCKVTRFNFLATDIPYSVDFAPVNLIFSSTSQTPACVGLQSASLPNEDTQTAGQPKLKGDDHGQRPKLRVQLNGLAHPVNGQTVFIKLNDGHNPKVARWLNGAPGDTMSFLIPPGQSAGEIEGFLGTRKVLSEKTISLTVSVNGIESGPLYLHVVRK